MSISKKTSKSQPSRNGLLTAFALAALMGVGIADVQAQTFNFNTGTQSWNVAGNWTPSGFPNSVGASATFNSLTAASTVNLGASITVGSMTFANNGAFARTLANGTGGSLILDATGSGEATISLSGTSTTTNNLTISASTTLNDTLRLTNSNVSGTGAATATITGTLTGSGGFIKDGPGRFSFSTVAKTYTGPTTINQGRLRMTGSGQMTGTSSIGVNSGGSLYLDNGSGVWAFGTTPASTTVSIAGDGDNGGGTGTQGALRNQGSGTNTLANPVALTAAATIHVDGSSTLQLNGGISGSSVLTKSGGGTLQYTAANAGLTGGTIATNGTISVNSGSQLGTGSLSFAQTTLNNPTVTLNNATQSISALSSTFSDTTGTQTHTLTLTGTALTINQATNTTFGAGAVSTLSSVIGGGGSVTKSGAGSLTLTSANTYTGTTTVSGGTLTLSNATGSALGSTSGINVTSGTLLVGASNQINNSANLTLGNGATFDLGGFSEGTSAADGLGALILATTGGSATLDFGTLAAGSSNVRFGSVGAHDGKLLITDYDFGTDHLYFAGLPGAFDFTQSNVSFNGVDGFDAISFSGGFEIVPVPEPTTILGAFGLVAFVAYRERRRFGGAKQANA